MPFSYHRFIFVGNITRQPELATTKSGNPMAKFSVAVNSTWKSAEGFKRKVQYFNIVVWDKYLVKRAEKLQIGEMVFVEGDIEPQTFVDKTGKKCYSIAFFATSLIAPRLSAIKPKGVDEETGELIEPDFVTEGAVKDAKKKQKEQYEVAEEIFDSLDI
jgi:single-strand DNA-binding protein